MIKVYSFSKNGSKSLSKHFAVKEFVSNVNGRIRYDSVKIDTKLINKLEKLFKFGMDSVVIISGYRHPKDSIAVGGYSNDAHTKGIAADIICYKNRKALKSKYVAALASLIGFSGIGIISETSVHVDVRNYKNYSNAHWWGDERTGNDNIVDFFKYCKISKAELYGEIGYYGESLYLIKAKRKTAVYYDENGKRFKKHYTAGKVARVWATKGKYSKVLSGWVKTADLKKI